VQLLFIRAAFDFYSSVKDVIHKTQDVVLDHQQVTACNVVCNAFFRLMMSCCIPEIFAIKSQSCAKSRQNFDVFGPPNFGGKGPPKFLTEFL